MALPNGAGGYQIGDGNPALTLYIVLAKNLGGFGPRFLKD
jgi:hypothetical protein